MAYQISLSAIAIKELEDSAIWYESQQKGLGLRFMESINNCFAFLSENPDTYSIKISDFREAKIVKFPYLIIYKIVKKTNNVRVFHIFHTKRNPAYKNT